MFILTWDHFKRDNKKLLKYLKVDDGSMINLSYHDGFFICPDDYINRQKHFPKILTSMSIIDIFKRDYKVLYHTVRDFFQIFEGFDRLNYEKFKIGAKISYFLGASYYVYYKKINFLEKINPLYKRGHASYIKRNLRSLLNRFIELAAKKNIKMNIYALFKFAKKIIKEKSPNIFFRSEFNNLTAFCRSTSFNPFSTFIGSKFEEKIQELFEEMQRDEINNLTKKISAEIGENGIMIPLDEDNSFKKAANKRAQGLCVPDYVFVSDTMIVPADLKTNLTFAKERQISAFNLKSLFNKLENKKRIIFSGLTIEGEFIETAEEEAVHKQRKKKSKSPMGLLKKEGVEGKYLKIIASLWSKEKPIDQETLKLSGVKHENLGMIVYIFNDMLEKRKLVKAA